MKKSIFILSGLLGLLSGLNPTGSTLLATQVTSLNDSGPGTLRDAISTAAPGDTITFALGGTIILRSALVITKNLTLIGPASPLILNGNNVDRVFDIAAIIQVGISHLTITGGQSGSGFGGGIFNMGTLTLNDCEVNSNPGGGLYNGGISILNRCELASNSDGTGSYGGGILNDGTLIINNCALFHNSAIDRGGGICNRGTLTLNNTTVWQNTAEAEGGGIYNSGGLSVVNCTISENTSFARAAGGLYQSDATGSTAIRNTIIARNGAAVAPVDVYGHVDSLGHNLISSFVESSGWVVSDLQGSNPLLGPLQDNGGGTPTLALLPGSPAIDAGDDAVLASPYNLTTDQRGRRRSSGAHVDIGALEVGPAPLVTNNNDSGPGSLRDATLIAGPNENVFFAPNVIGTITLLSGEIVIAKSRNIVGPGAPVLTVSGNNVSRVFHLTGGDSAISGLRLANGHTTGSGGGIDLESGSTVIVDSCTVDACYAQGADAGSLGGGAISLVNATTLSLINSTISGNTTPENGGGILLYAGANASLVNCTVSGNRTLDSSSDTGGGGICLYNANVLNVNNSTIANNSSASVGGGIYKGFNGTATFRNSLVAGNTAPGGPDCFGPYASAGYNLIGNTSGSTGFGAAGDQLNRNPQLLPLAYNGSPTMTHALFTTSPAVDAGTGGLAADQRGKLRPFDFPSVANASVGNGSDIGAFEVNPPEASIVQSGNNVVISWPSYYVGYTVQSTTDPSLLTGWLPVPGTPALVGDHYTLTAAINPNPTWYRLKAP
jgi:parallel beta-helix repeat protein